jgi:hypothetical protein
MLDIYFAEQMMELKEVTIAISFVSTMWSGRNIMIAWNNLNNDMIDIFCFDDISEEDLVDLYAITEKFLEKHNL